MRGYILNYYEVAILKSPLQNLTYQSEEIIENGSLVEVILANRKNSNLAVVIKKVDKPDFKCSTILSIKDEFYSDSRAAPVYKFLQADTNLSLESSYYVKSR